MRFRLVAREETFFDLLEEASENLDRAGKLLVETLKNPEDLDLSAQQMKAGVFPSPPPSDFSCAREGRCAA